MKRLALGVAILAISTASAMAADMAAAPVYTKAPAYAAPIYNWTGFYIGVNGGGGWGSASSTDVINRNATSHNPNGGIAGGQIGYNWQRGVWVFGLEADGDWADITGSAACPNPTFTCASNTRALASFRGRVGYAAGPVLLYGTGGAGYANTSFDESPAIVGIPGSFRTDRWGYAAGAGIEWGFAPQWSAKLEYMHYGFDSVTAAPGILSTDPVATSVRFDTVKAGLNYRFGGPVVARY